MAERDESVKKYGINKFFEKRFKELDMQLRFFEESVHTLKLSRRSVSATLRAFLAGFDDVLNYREAELRRKLEHISSHRRHLVCSVGVSGIETIFHEDHEVGLRAASEILATAESIRFHPTDDRDLHVGRLTLAESDGSVELIEFNAYF